MRKYLFSFMTILFFLFSASVYSNVDQTKNKTALLEVQEKIKNLEQSLYNQAQEEKTQLKSLADIEKELGRQAEKLRHLENQKQSHEASLKNLEEQRKGLEHTHHQQLSALVVLIQSEYQHQQKEKIQLLFELHEWSNLARLNEYFRIFYHARAARIDEIKKELSQLHTLQESLRLEKIEVESLATQIKNNHIQLKEKHNERQTLITKFSKQRSQTSDKLSQLQKQENHLNQVFKTLKESLPVTPAYIDPVQNFSKMKKRLSLPVQASGSMLSLLPHAKKSNAKKTYIEAPEGTPVNAIFPGKVVFAEWLRGVGLLVIVDHGNGYMSLYGNNQTLYKSLGETVNQGEMIARVGQSGGQAKPGLYFEIRKDGETLDPAPWFKTS